MEKRANPQKLLAFGFVKTDEGYCYRTELLCGQMALTVRLDASGAIKTRVTDASSGEEYILHRVAGASGAFVGQVREEYEAALERIWQSCFEPEGFRSRQAKAVVAYMQQTYGDEPEFLWKKFPNVAAVRRKENQTWYAVLFAVSRRKLGMESDEPAEILDLRIRPEDAQRLVDGKRFFPGYHMNKRHWITICLDGKVPTQEICRRIDESWALAKK